MEEVMKYLIGTEIGIIKVEDFANFIDNEIVKLDDIPDIYIEISLHIKKGINELLNVISKYCYDNDIALNNKQNDKIKRELLEIVEEKYKNKEIDLKECVNFIHKLSMHFNGIDDANLVEIIIIISH